MTPGQRGALEEIARRINAGRNYSIKELRGIISDDDYTLLEAIHVPLEARDKALVDAANADATRIAMPAAVEAYKKSLSGVQFNNGAGAGRLKRNRARIEKLKVKISEDEALEEKYKKWAWEGHDKLNDEERRWLHPRTSTGWPSTVSQRVPLAVANGGADPAEIEAIKKLLRRLLGTEDGGQQ